jgi:hypothetical protein
MLRGCRPTATRLVNGPPERHALVMHRLAMVILLLSSACAEDPIVPDTGRWRYMELRVVEDSCDTPALAAMGDFDITRANEDGFTVDPLDQPPFECALSGASYDCNDRSVDYSDDAVDATVTLTVSASGTFSSPTATSGEQVYRATCSGPDCNLAETFLMTSFPCDKSVEYSANLSGS